MSSAGNYNDEGSDINIRGVDSTAGTSTTGIYIDDTPIQTRHIGFGSINAFPALFDLDRVEVLRGPQGTLFGAGAEGGVVRFIAPEPEAQQISGYARADAATTEGGAPSYEGGAAFGAPIIDDVLAFRASVSFRRDGGWVDRVELHAVAEHPVALPTPVYNGDDHQPNANSSETTTARLRRQVAGQRYARDHAVDLLSAPADQRHRGLLDLAVESGNERVTATAMSGPIPATIRSP